LVVFGKSSLQSEKADPEQVGTGLHFFPSFQFFGPLCRFFCSVISPGQFFVVFPPVPAPRPWPQCSFSPCGHPFSSFSRPLPLFSRFFFSTVGVVLVVSFSNRDTFLRRCQHFLQGHWIACRLFAFIPPIKGSVTMMFRCNHLFLPLVALTLSLLPRL